LSGAAVVQQDDPVAKARVLPEHHTMTDRKPPGVDFGTWVERKIREAAERGAFDNLPGAGKPIPDLDTPHDELWWIKRKLREEGLAHLPPTIALRK
jgi:hypothetical protein